jgi:hypothetical protein
MHGFEKNPIVIDYMGQGIAFLLWYERIYPTILFKKYISVDINFLLRVLIVHDSLP